MKAVVTWIVEHRRPLIGIALYSALFCAGAAWAGPRFGVAFGPDVFLKLLLAPVKTAVAVLLTLPAVRVLAPSIWKTTDPLDLHNRRESEFEALWQVQPDHPKVRLSVIVYLVTFLGVCAIVGNIW